MEYVTVPAPVVGVREPCASTAVLSNVRRANGATELVERAYWPDGLRDTISLETVLGVLDQVETKLEDYMTEFWKLR